MCACEKTGTAHKNAVSPKIRWGKNRGVEINSKKVAKNPQKITQNMIKNGFFMPILSTFLMFLSSRAAGPAPCPGKPQTLCHRLSTAKAPPGEPGRQRNNSK
jgi:hypothetical protein